LKDILQTLFDREAGNDGQLGDFKLHKPVDFGGCICDFGILCSRFKRKGNFEKDKMYKDMAMGVWDEPFSELLRCPRGLEEPKTPPPLPETAGFAAKALWVLHRVQERIQSLAFTIWGMFLPFLAR
jgi:hypothetical protein